MTGDGAARSRFRFHLSTIIDLELICCETSVAVSAMVQSIKDKVRLHDLGLEREVPPTSAYSVYATI